MRQDIILASNGKVYVVSTVVLKNDFLGDPTNGHTAVFELGRGKQMFENPTYSDEKTLDRLTRTHYTSEDLLQYHNIIVDKLMSRNPLSLVNAAHYSPNC